MILSVLSGPEQQGASARGPAPHTSAFVSPDVLSIHPSSDPHPPVQRLSCRTPVPAALPNVSVNTLSPFFRHMRASPEWCERCAASSTVQHMLHRSELLPSDGLSSRSDGSKLQRDASTEKCWRDLLSELLDSYVGFCASSGQLFPHLRPQNSRLTEPGSRGRLSLWDLVSHGRAFPPLRRHPRVTEHLDMGFNQLTLTLTLL